MISLELLAPAKNLECGKAAVDHGADAVYIGASHFGARAAVGNSLDDIHELCVYAHLYDVKVYVTVNTILYDDELTDSEQLISKLYEIGVDAILVQDMSILRMNIPPIALHASTQTDNRSVEKVRWLESLGFQRVVLARELSVDEIADIHKAVPEVSLEVFVHGALCVCYSGLCYASQYCFGRSANRGECAQFCRMKFDLVDSNNKEIIHQRHLLSLKDMNQSHHLEELIRAGATSFKIEGRLKDVMYVKNVVAAYSSRLNAIIEAHPGLYCRSSKGRCSYGFMPNLEKTFNRGFTDYFIHGRQPHIFSPYTAKAMGEYVGYVKSLRRDHVVVAGSATFANGDGLCFINEKHELEGFRVNRVEGNHLYPYMMPRTLQAKMALYRNNDQEFERLLSRPSCERKIPIRIRLEVTANGFALSVGVTRVSMVCEHQQAEKPQRQQIVWQLSKLGGTPYECEEVIMPENFSFFIPNSMLSELRRLLVRALMEESNKSIKKHEVLKQNISLTPLQPYDRGYLYNIANKKASLFYKEQGLDNQEAAIELQRVPKSNCLLMQCRHCIRYSLGHCVKYGGVRADWHEPLFLRLGDGRRFRLEFDCQSCQMNVYASDEV